MCTLTCECLLSAWFCIIRVIKHNVQNSFHLWAFFLTCSVIYQLSDISMHSQLSIEQTLCIFKQIHSFVRNVPIWKNLSIEKKLVATYRFVIQCYKRDRLESWLFHWVHLPAWKNLTIEKKAIAMSRFIDKYKTCY